MIIVPVSTLLSRTDLTPIAQAVLAVITEAPVLVATTTTLARAAVLLTVPSLRLMRNSCLDWPMLPLLD